MPRDILARNNVKVFGRGSQPMLFAHGFGCDQNMWRFVTPAFEADYRLVLFDYVGAGKSDLAAYDASRYASLEGYARDVLDIVHALDLWNVIFVGHSVSSMVGVLAANAELDDYDDVSALIVFPPYQPAEILELARAGLRVPTGITRHIIPARALRVNVPLDLLRDPVVTLAEKNAWWHEHVKQKLVDNEIRYYQESTYLFDE